MIAPRQVSIRFFMRRLVLVSSMFSLCLVFFVGSSFAAVANPVTIASTIPSNGDLNPYGIARVPRTVGLLTRGNILVSNFNNSNNLQGTGTTIVQIAPDGSVSLFAQIDPTRLPGPCPGGRRLTTTPPV